MNEQTSQRPMDRYAHSKWATAHDHGVFTFGATQPILSALELGGFEVRDLFLMGMDEDYGAIIVEDQQRAEEVAAALEPAYTVTISPEDPEGRTDGHWKATYTLVPQGGEPARMLTNLKPVDGAGFDDTDDVLAAARKELRDPWMWAAPSGEPVSGEQVAQHLEAAADLMEDQNWDPQVYRPEARRSLRSAVLATTLDGRGDDDTVFIVRNVLQALLKARMNALTVDYGAWAEHGNRTLAEVTATARTAARLARETGPAPRP